MKKQIVYAVLVIAVLAVIGLFFAQSKSAENEATGRSVSGVVSSLDLEQAMVDGPYVVVIKTESGSEETVHVPSMGIRLCAAPEKIMSPSELKAGDRVEVKGTLTAEGFIIPCESADHYLRKAL